MLDASEFTFFDGIILAIVGLSAIFGFRRGFVTEVLSLAAWAGAVVLTVFGLNPATEFFREYVSPDVVADVIAFVALFIGGLIILKLAASWIGEGVRSSFMGPLDRSAGILFGVLRGALIVSFAYLLFSIWVPAKNFPDSVKDASLRPLLEYGAEMLAIVGPELLEKARGSEDLEDILKEAQPTSAFTDQDGYAERAREDLTRKIAEEVLERAQQEDEDR